MYNDPCNVDSYCMFEASCVVLGNLSVWAISPEERDKHDQKFDTLSPSMGNVSGTHIITHHCTECLQLNTFPDKSIMHRDI